MTERVLAAFVPLVDCAVLVAARERGFAAEAGLDLQLVKEPSWASLRDHLCLGHVDCAHALAPLPVALTLGVGQVQVDCIAPFVLSRGGNAITVSNRLFAEMCENASPNDLAGPTAAGRALARAARQRSAPLTLAMVFPFSNHNFDLRYWLAAAGVHPDREVRLVAVPPPLMVESLRAGLVDGFCVGAPWNSLAVAEGLGTTIVTQSQLFPRAAEKVLAMRAAFAQRPLTLAKLLRALDAAAAWVDDPANHAELAAQLARSAYLNLPPEIILAALAGRVNGGTRLEKRDAEFMFFHRDAANVPDAADGVWCYAQMARWGQVAPDAAAETAAARVFRPDLYCQSLSVASVSTVRPPSFDRRQFSGTDVERYLAQFELNTAFAGDRSA